MAGLKKKRQRLQPPKYTISKRSLGEWIEGPHGPIDKPLSHLSFSSSATLTLLQFNYSETPLIGFLGTRKIGLNKGGKLQGFRFDKLEYKGNSDYLGIEIEDFHCTLSQS